MATQPDKTNTGVVATIVGVGVFAMISISAMVTAMVRSDMTELNGTRPLHADLETVAALKHKQLAALNAPPHRIDAVDEAPSKLAIPIDLAMKLVLAEYRKNPAAASPPPPPGLVMDPTAAANPGAPGAVPAAPGMAAPPAPVGAGAGINAPLSAPPGVPPAHAAPPAHGAPP